MTIENKSKRGFEFGKLSMDAGWKAIICVVELFLHALVLVVIPGWHSLLLRQNSFFIYSHSVKEYHSFIKWINYSILLLKM